MAEHTKGPWRINPPLKPEGIGAGETQIQGSEVVHTSGQDYKPSDTYHGRLSSKSASNVVAVLHGDVGLSSYVRANACLIAAAPDLLEAATWGLDALLGIPESEQIGLSAIRELRAAIKKAKP